MNAKFFKNGHFKGITVVFGRRWLFIDQFELFFVYGLHVLHHHDL
jgi:hypothetical protein